MYKAGFVNIVGNPNVGKSTLMNQLVGERISIATFKAQTTRHRILGILNTDDAQICFSDTPGVLKPNYKLPLLKRDLLRLCLINNIYIFFWAGYLTIHPFRLSKTLHRPIHIDWK
jgi:ribosome biogenesis GTPase A